jgi:hypothetical protein
MVLGFIKCLGAGDRPTFDIGLTRSVGRRGGLALGVLHSIGRRLMMKQPPNGCGAALQAGSRVPDCRSSCAICKSHGPLRAVLPPRSTVAPVVAMRRPA